MIIDRLTDLIILIPKGISRTTKIVEVAGEIGRETKRQQPSPRLITKNLSLATSLLTPLFAESVAQILSNTNSSSTNEALRIRIEEDLIQEVSKKEREGLLGRLSAENPDVMKRLLEGGGDDDGRSSSKSSSKSSPPSSLNDSTLSPPPTTKKYSRKYNQYNRAPPPTRRNTKPHFSGIGEIGRGAKDGWSGATAKASYRPPT